VVGHALSIASASLSTQRLRLYLFLLAVPVVFGLLLAVARARDRVSLIPRILSEPPEDLHPVDLALLWSAYRHHLSPRTAYRAEIVHLAGIGSIELVPVGRVSDPDDFVIRLREVPEDEVDYDFVAFMFPDADDPESEPDVSLSSLRMSRSSKPRLITWWNDAFSHVGSSIERMWADLRLEFLLAFLIAVFVLPIIAANLAPDMERLGGIGLLAFAIGPVGWLLTIWALPARLSGDLRDRVMLWISFRRYLKRFSSLRDAPAEGVIIWEQYLELATALGVAGRVGREIRGMDVTGRLPAPWNGAPVGLAGVAWLRHVWRRGPRRVPQSLLSGAARSG
jgi:hypothetical protein